MRTVTLHKEILRPGGARWLGQGHSRNRQHNYGTSWWHWTSIFLVLTVVCWWWPQDSLCASHKVFGWASLRKKVKPLPSVLIIPEDLAGGFLGLVSQWDLQDLFSKYLQKGKKRPTRSFCKGEDWELRKNKWMHAEAWKANWAGRLRLPWGHFSLMPPVDTVTRPWGTVCHRLKAQRTRDPPIAWGNKTWTDTFSQMTHLQEV